MNGLDVLGALGANAGAGAAASAGAGVSSAAATTAITPSSFKSYEVDWLDHAILYGSPVVGLGLGLIFGGSHRLLAGLAGLVLGAAKGTGVEIARGRNPLDVLAGHKTTSPVW